MTTTHKVYQALALAIEARANCKKEMEKIQSALASGDLSDDARRSNHETHMLRREWFNRHTDRIRRIVRDCMPSGSGFDSGCEIDLDNSTPDRIVVTTSFHHMNDGGMYDGWSQERVTCVPSLGHGIRVRVMVTERNRHTDDGWREYAHEVFQSALDAECPGASEWNMTAEEWDAHVAKMDTLG